MAKIYLAGEEVFKVQFYLNGENLKKLKEYEAKNKGAKKFALRSRIFCAGMNQVIKQKG